MLELRAAKSIGHSSFRGAPRIGFAEIPAVARKAAQHHPRRVPAVGDGRFYKEVGITS